MYYPLILLNSQIPEVIEKVDEFLYEASRCTRRVSSVAKIFKSLASGNIANMTTQSILLAIDELKKQQGNYINMACYSVLKRKYAQEIQFIFFMG